LGKKEVFLEEVLMRSPGSLVKILDLELRGWLSSLEHLHATFTNLLSLSFYWFFSLFFER